MHAAMLRNLNKREKWFIYAAVMAVCVFGFVRFILFPVMDNRARLRRVLEVNTQNLSEIQGLQLEYERISQLSITVKEQFAKRDKGFTLFSFLDKLAREAGIKDNIVYMKPSSSVPKKGELKKSMIEMKLQSVALPKLTDYLFRVETNKNMVIIKRASFVRTGKDKGAMNVVLQVEAFEA